MATRLAENICRVKQNEKLYGPKRRFFERKDKTKTIDRGKFCLFCGNEVHRDYEEYPAFGKTCSACGKSRIILLAYAVLLDKFTLQIEEILEAKPTTLTTKLAVIFAISSHHIIVS